jgi:integrase
MRGGGIILFLSGAVTVLLLTLISQIHSEAMQLRLNSLVMGLFGTWVGGCRRGEILAVRWSEVLFDNKAVTIARSLTEKMTFKAPKNDRTRTLAMSDTLCAVLRSHKAAQAKNRLLLGEAYKDQGLVFCHADGSPVDPWNFGSAVRDCIARSGVAKITLHRLRDTHASLLAKAGVPLEVVSKRLGHSNIAITAERYLDVYSDRDEAAAISRLSAS